MREPCRQRHSTISPPIPSATCAGGIALLAGEVIAALWDADAVRALDRRADRRLLDENAPAPSADKLYALLLAFLEESRVQNL